MRWYKKIIFASIVTVGFFSAFEALLVMLAYRPLSTTQDPLLGFSGRFRLMETDRDPDGTEILRTAVGKRVWFNDQSFPKAKPAGTKRVFCVGGSTTYGRPYQDATSYCGWLREFLPLADPSSRWEVINAGGISYASYRVAEVMKELARYEPDFFIVYSAHNEFLERRTYAGLFETPRWRRDATAALQRTRVGSLFHQILRGRAASPESPVEILPAEVDEILNHSIGPQDYRRDDVWQVKVLRHYESNLRYMVEIARDSGAEIVFVTPACNLRDCQPFKSVFAEDRLSSGTTQNSRRLDRAVTDLRAGRFADVLTGCENILKADPRNPAARYHLGQAYFGLARYEQAEAAFRRAVDEDICPLRAVTRIGDTVRRVAEGHAVVLIDFERELARLSRREHGHGCFGRDYFVDHVHPTIDVHRRLSLWILDRLQQESLVGGKPPGSDQLDEVRARVESRIDSYTQGAASKNLAKVMHWAGKFSEAAAHARDAIDRLPDDLESRFLLADCLLNTQRRDEAFAKYEELFSLGEFQRGYVPFAELLIERGRYREAKSYLLPAILEEDHDRRQNAFYWLGIVHLRLREFEFSLESFEQLDDRYQADVDVLRLIAEARAGLNDDPAVGDSRNPESGLSP